MVRVLTGYWAGSGLRRRDQGWVAAPGREVLGSPPGSGAGPRQRLVGLASVRETVKPLPVIWFQHSMPDSEEVQAKVPFLALDP